jgi:hypothetical protein
VGGACEVTGGVTGTWLKTGSGAYRLTAAGPANTLPGSAPQLSLPTTGGLVTAACTAVGSSPPFLTLCSGGTSGDAAQNGSVTVTFQTTSPAGARGSAQATQTVTGQLGGPPSCQPRPDVTVAVTPGDPGRLQVSLITNISTGITNNLLWAVRVGSATNATVQSGNQQGSGNFTITPAPGAQQVALTVIRTTAGQAATVPLRIADACGEWETFVGGGATAF